MIVFWFFFSPLTFLCDPRYHIAGRLEYTLGLRDLGFVTSRWYDQYRTLWFEDVGNGSTGQCKGLGPVLPASSRMR